jgi:hypothetical protein
MVRGAGTRDDGHLRFSPPGSCADRHRRDHGGGEQQDLQRDGLAVEVGGQRERHEGLQQLHLRHPRDAAHRHAGIPREESDPLRKHRDIQQRQPWLQRDMAEIRRHGQRGCGQRDRQAHHQHPTDDLPSRHLSGEAAGEGIADRGQGHGGEQQQVAGRERAAALAHRERDHQCRARHRRDPEQWLRPFVGDRDRDQRGCDRQNPEHHAAMRGIDSSHRERHQEWKQHSHAQHHDRQLSP